MDAKCGYAAGTRKCLMPHIFDLGHVNKYLLQKNNKNKSNSTNFQTEPSKCSLNLASV
jgi:hypothetical protein